MATTADGPAAPPGRGAWAAHVAGVLLLVVLCARPLLRDVQFPRASLWLYLAVCAAAVLYAGAVAGGSRGLRMPSAVAKPFAVFWFCVLLASLTSVQQMHSTEAVLSLLAWSAIFLLAAQCGRGAVWRAWAVRGLLGVGALLALLAVAQRTYLFDLLRAQPEAALLEPLRVQSNRAFATFLSPGVYGAYLALILPWQLGVADGRWATGTRRRRLVLLAALVALHVAALVLTRSRAGWLAVGVALLAYAFITRPRRMRWLYVWPPVAAGLLLLAARPELAATNTLQARMSYWRGSVEMIRLRPWSGVGPGAWGDAFPTTFVPGASPTQLAHNDWLQQTAETGILGGLMFAVFAGVVLWIGARGIRAATSDMQLRRRAGLWCGVLGVCVAACFEYPMQTPSVSWVLAGAMGLLVAQGTLDMAEPPRGWWRWPVAAAVAAVMFAAAGLTYRYDQAREAWAVATLAAARQDDDAVEAACRRVIALAPLDPDAYGLLGLVYLQRGGADPESGAYGVAAPYAAAASVRAPWSPWQADRAGIAHWRLAQVNQDAQARAQAVAYFRRARAHFPAHPGFHIRLAGVMGSIGHADAEAAFHAAVAAHGAWRDSTDIAGPSALGEDLDLW